MKPYRRTAVLALSLWAGSAIAQLTAPVTRTALRPGFEPNAGQARPDADFVVHGPGYTLLLGSGGADLTLSSKVLAVSSREQILRMRLAGGSFHRRGAGQDPLGAKSNYLIGNQPNRWLTGIPQFGRVEYRGVYPGIDLVYHGGANELEYDFVVAPGANPRRIQLSFEGAERMRIDDDGDLILKVGGREIRERKPVVYQDTPRGRQTVETSYVARGRNRVGFNLSHYDKGASLVIDPALQFSSYFGGSGADSGFGVALDTSGNIYFSGETNSTTLPGVEMGQAFSDGGTAAFVAKVSSSGALIWSTYIGGYDDQAVASAMAVDGSGDAYLSGSTVSSTFPVLNAIQPALGGSRDAFALELNSSGNSFVYSTFLGGSLFDYAEGLSVDSAGNAYVTGTTESTNFPIVNASQPALAGTGNTFVTKIAPNGSALVYSTYIGGNGVDFSNGSTIDGQGNLYVYGDTSSTNFPVLNAIQPTFCGWQPGQQVTNNHGWFAELNGTGYPVFATYICGSAAADAVRGAGVDSNGNIILGGNTASTTFPTLNPIQAQYGGGTSDGFVMKLAPGGSLVYSTYLGGNGEDEVDGIAVDALGNPYMTGQTSSTNFPLLNPVQGTYGGNADAYLTKFNAAGASIVFSTYLGGSGQEQARSIALDSLADAYLAGYTTSSNFPTAGAFQNSYGGGTNDAFISEISTCGFSFSQPPVLPAGGGSGSVSITTTPECGWSASTNAAWINFTSATSGAGSGSVSFSANANSGATQSGTITIAGQNITITQTGTIPAVTLSPSSLTFASQTAGTTSGAQAITLTNNGPGTLTVSAIGITGTNSADFSEINTCSTPLAVNAMCSISVTFTPQASGTRMAWLSITDNASGSPQSVSLGGTGVATGPSGTWPNGYSYEATFTVAANQAPAAQTNFPALISGTFADFATVASGGRVQNTCSQTVGNNAISVPCDLIFTSDSAGAMPVSWEFESYNAATGAVNIWVNVPSLSNGTVIYAWYGQSSVTTLQTTPSATWNGSFEAVYHFSENPATTSGQLNDSTANANNATLTGTVAAGQQQTGKIGGSINFEGDTWAALPNVGAFGFDRTNSFSLSGWFKMPAVTGTLISKMPTQNVSGWALMQGTSGGNPDFFMLLQGQGAKSEVLTIAPATSANVWHYLVATYSGTSTAAGVQIYIDGVQQSLTTSANDLSTTLANTATPAINGRGGANYETTDSIDEIRISAQGVVFPASWVTTSYNNQSHPGTFFTVQTGLTSSPAQLPTVTPSPSSITFTDQTVDTTSSAQVITVTNNGPGSLTVSGVSITGMNPGDFGETNTCSAPIAVNATCTISVTFTPQAAGMRTASVSITDNGTGSPQSVGLTGTGAAAVPTVGLSPTSLTFASQTTGTTSSAQAITVTNSGPGSLTVSGVSITGMNPGDFGETNTCSAPIAVNTTCMISVTFTPQATGTRTASVSITDNGTGSPQSVGLTGTGAASVPTVGLSPTSLTFASQTTGTTSSAQAITVTNNGPGSLTVSGISIAGMNPGDFGETNTCSAPIAVNATCMISVTFTPQATGTRTASVSITDNGTGSPQSVGLTGTGAAAVPTVGLSPTSLTFASQTTGTTSGAQVITVTNNGPGSLTVSGVSITGMNPGDFGETNTCSAPIALNATCTISVTFTPQATGTRTASVSITDNGAGSPQSVGLTGTGAAAVPTVGLSPTSLTFASQTTGTTSSAQVITVTNNGPGSLTVSGISIAGMNPGDFGETNTCSAPIAVNATCMISVTFTPQATGTRTASVSITDNGAGSPQSVGLTGTGAAAGQPTVTLSPSSLTFASQMVGTSSASQTITMTNNGPGILTGSTKIAGADPSDYSFTTTCTGQLAANASCNFLVKFTPQATGTRSAVLSVTTNATNSPANVGLSGTGATPVPVISLSPSSLTFAAQTVGTSSTAQVVTLTNYGPGVVSGSVKFTGADTGDFSKTTTCTGAVPVNSSCTFSVTFTPQATGTRTATLLVTTNAAGSPQGIGITGTGQ